MSEDRFDDEDLHREFEPYRVLHVDEVIMAEYVEGILDEWDAAIVEAHLAECEHCRQVLEEMKQIQPGMITLQDILDYNKRQRSTEQ